MKNIRKSIEPRSLTEHRAINPLDYGCYQGKDELRVSLCSEQGGICCYCMDRIRPVAGSMKIEHWQSQENHPDQRLVYANLLAGCMGGEGYRPKDQHCDTFKANRDLCRNPANPAHNVEVFVQYEADGSIAATDPLFNDHLNSVLNLNLPFLQANRKAALDSFKKFLALRRGKIATSRWQQILREWNGTAVADGVRPYAGVVTYWIRRHLV